MERTWYKIANRTDFEDSGLVSQSVNVTTNDRGSLSVVLTHGNYISLVFNGVLLPVEFDGKNPFAFGGYAVYVDETADIWLGFDP